MKKIFFVLLLSLYSIVSFANHTKGGWMFYQYEGPGTNPSSAKYKVVLYLYMICNPNSGQLVSQINLSIFTGSNQFSQTVTATLAQDPNIQNCPSCDPCIINKPNICYKYARYEVNVELPITGDGYIISYQRCCRITGIVNIIAPSNTVGDTWEIKIPGIKDLSTAPKNSSPLFTPNDTAVICANNFFTFNFTATDPDGDVLAYDFAPAYTGGTSTNPSPPVAGEKAYPQMTGIGLGETGIRNKK